MGNVLEAIEKRSSTRGYQLEKLTGAELDYWSRPVFRPPRAYA